jgi:hypothetical protein
MVSETPRYLTEVEVKNITGISLSQLRNQRANRKGIPYIKVGNGRSVRYKITDVICYMEAGRVQLEEVVH